MARSSIIRVSVLADTKGFSRQMSEVEQRFGKFGSKVDRLGQAAGKVLAGGLAVAGAAAYKAGQAASDLAESTSKAAQIFGTEAMPMLNRFANGAAKSIGQSKQTALDAASTFGTFGKAAGKTGQDLARFSIVNTRLASDLASFHNTTPEEAIEALGAAFRGEAEPIRRFGVLLDDATLRQEALKLGLIKTTSQALTPQQKVLAAQSAIMKQTGDAQGDFARTSDGLANKQRILKAQMENLQASIGQKVLPIMVKLSEVGLKAVSWVDKHQRLVGILVGVLGGFAAILYVVSAAMRAWVVITRIWAGLAKVAAAAQWLLNVAMSANPIALIVIAIVALIAIFVLAYKKCDWFREAVNKVWGFIKKAVKAVWDWIKDKIVDNVVNFVKRAIRGARIMQIALRLAWEKIKAKVKAVWDWIKDKIVDNVVDFVKRVILGAKIMRERLREAWTRIVTMVREKITAFMEKVRGIKDKVKNALSNAGSWLVNAGKDLITGLWNGIKSLGGWLKDKIVGFISDNVPGPVKKVLGIESPSKVFRQFGRWTVEGLELGIKDRTTNAQRASTRLAGAVTGGWRTPALGGSPRPAFAGSTGGSGNTYNITVEVPVGASPAQVGKEIVRYIDAYERSGGRRRSR